MTGNQLRDALTLLGWHQTELAFRLGVDRSTVRRAVALKEEAIPGPIAAYVDLATRIKRTWGAWLEPKAGKEDADTNEAKNG